jgi:hypothetical protein
MPESFRITLLLLLTLPHGHSFCQSAAEEAVLAMFGKDAKVAWVRHYKGKLDGFNDLTLTLAYNGKQCLGQMTYLRSKVTFQMRGTLLDERLTLDELYGPDAIKTGTVVGTLRVDGITGKWHRFDGKVSGALDFLQVAAPPDFPSYCGANQWLRRYVGKLDGQDTELILHHSDKGGLSGVACWENDGASYAISGQQDSNEEDCQFALLEGGKFIDGFKGKLLRNGKELDGRFSNSKNAGNAVFDLKEEMAVGCEEYMDFFAKYEFVYPKTDSRTLNDHLEQLLAPWRSSCMLLADSLHGEYGDTPSPYARAAMRASVWYELLFWSEDLMGGILFYTNSLRPGTEAKSFNFDLKNKREVALKDIFSKKHDYSVFIKNYISEAIKRHDQYSDPKFRKWVADVPFDNYVFQSDGIRFFSPHSPVFGSQSVLVPYEQLKQYMVAKGNPLTQLIGDKLSGGGVPPKQRKKRIFFRNQGASVAQPPVNRQGWVVKADAPFVEL